MNIGSGTISIQDIDKFKDYPHTDVVTISGLHQDTFEQLIRTYGGQLKAIRFFKKVRGKLVFAWYAPRS